LRKWRLLSVTLGVVICVGVGGCGGAAAAGRGTAGAGMTGAGGDAGGAAPAGMAGGAGTTSGDAGTNGGASAGSFGGSPGGSLGGMTGEAGSGAPSLDGAAGTGGTSDGGAPDASGSKKILVYCVTTGYRHASIPAAANAIAEAAAAVGLTTEQVGCGDAATNIAEPTKFTAASLAEYGAVILLANSGEPIGYPATQEIQNLVDYVQHGGALVAIEDASHCYDGQFNGHPASQPYVQLIGGDFVGHPGDVTPATCTKVGTQPSVVQLPATFGTTDEVYAFSQFRTDNQVVLSCVSSGDPTHTVRPVSWQREEGAGRYFFTALGHNDVSWTAPMDVKAPSSRLVEDHVLPALLWATRR
jgi:type 1 glutamine amidotransferase